MYALRRSSIRKGLLIALLIPVCLVAVFAFAKPTFANTHQTAQPAAPATSCYGQAQRIGPYVIKPTNFYIITTYVATKYCNDINFKATQQRGPTLARVIFKDIRTGNVKGYGAWKRINSANTWYVLATDVINGTHFTLQFDVPYKGTTFAGWMAS